MRHSVNQHSARVSLPRTSQTGDLRTHPPTSLVDDDVVPGFTDQLASPEGGGRQVGKDVGDDLEWEGGDRRTAGPDSASVRLPPLPFQCTTQETRTDP